MGNSFETILRVFIAFGILLLLIRVLGKKQMSQISFFTYITGIALGNIAGEMVSHKDIEILDTVIGLAFWTFLTFIVEYISMKSPKFRTLFDGEPTIVIKKGRIVKKAMASSRLNMDELTMLLRSKDVFSVTEVEYAILEQNGELSVLKKQNNNNQQGSKKHDILPRELIVDGRIVKRNLHELGKSEDWLLDQLKNAGVNTVNQVFFAEMKNDGSLYIDKVEEK